MSPISLGNPFTSCKVGRFFGILPVILARLVFSWLAEEFSSRGRLLELML
jgi:hypothetical protein